MLQTSLGYMFSHFQNMTGHVRGVNYYEGRTIVRLDENYLFNDQFLGISLGAYVLGENIAYGPNDHTGNINLFAHEFGHTYQSRIAGPFYLFKYGIPSALHGFESTAEDDADYRAYEKFGFWPHGRVREPNRYKWWETLFGPLVLFWNY